MWAVLPIDKYIRGIEELVAEANRDGSERIIAVVGGIFLKKRWNRTLREQTHRQFQKLQRSLTVC